MTPYEAAMWNSRPSAFLLVVLLFLPRPARAAQQPAGAAVGEEVFVTHTGSGQPVRGRLIELSSTSLAILVGGRRVDVPVDDVLRIDVRGDSVKDGAIIGAGVMVGLTALSCAAVDDAGYCVTALILNTGIGALVGAGIDALHKGRTPIYIKAGKSNASLQVKISF
jgi:hypothetical protein